MKTPPPSPSGPAGDGILLPGGLRIPPGELRFAFVRAGGPGGQNVNKVATKAVLRFDLAGSRALPEETRVRLAAALASRLTDAGEILVAASEHRTQEGNRAAALARLRALLAEALRPRPVRRRSRPTRASVARRLTEKRRRSARKSERAGGGDFG